MIRFPDYIVLMFAGVVAFVGVLAAAARGGFPARVLVGMFVGLVIGIVLRALYILTFRLVKGKWPGGNNSEA